MELFITNFLCELNLRMKEKVKSKKFEPQKLFYRKYEVFIGLGPQSDRINAIRKINERPS